MFRLHLVFAIIFLCAIAASAAGTWTDGQNAASVLGQPNFSQAVAQAGPTGMFQPSSVRFDPVTGKLFVADCANARILRFSNAQAFVSGGSAEAVFGQADFNGVTGGFTQSKIRCVGEMAIDSAGRLWVADTDNNRVLRWDNAATLGNNAPANAVLGQPDFTSIAAGTTQSKMNNPEGVFVDAAGTLWVADTNNNRVLRFDSAATKANGANANSVLGQPDFTSSTGSMTQNSFLVPNSVIGNAAGSIWVSDAANDRVLRFDNAAAKAIGANADSILGSTSYTAKTFSGTTASSMDTPEGLALDATARLYVSDGNNDRVLIFNSAATLGPGAAASNVLGQTNFTSSAAHLSQNGLDMPYTPTFDESTQSLWVPDLANNRVMRFSTSSTTPTPTVSGIIPTSGPQAGGTSVTITGTNFIGGATVSFGGVAATNVSVVNATTITANSPAGTGTVHVTVSTSLGTSTTSANDQFTYTAQAQTPTVTGLSPTSGPQAGGTSVTITGTNFVNGATVSFGGVAATNVTFVNAATITATSPQGTGTVHVTVTTPGGTSATSSNDQFTYTAPSSSTISFSTNIYSIDEGGGHIDVTVTRSGDTSGVATVDYTTEAGGTASQKSDYEIALGTLTFGPGDTTKTFRVLIVDDTFVEGLETIGLQLSNPTGTNAVLGSPSTATISILENDTAPTTTNPYDTASFFVRQNYFDFLNREPDTGGLNFWTNEITSCGNDANCIAVKRINVSAAFFLSNEFQTTGFETIMAHRAAFGTLTPSTPIPVVYTTFMHDNQELGNGYAFGAPGADAVIEANKVAYFNDFVNRPAFLTKYPLGLTASKYVDNILTTAGLPTIGTFRDSLVTGLGNGSETRASVMRKIAESTALKSREFNNAFVLMQYFGYLRRDPNAAPDSDYSGYNFWLGKLNQFNGDYIASEMVKAFITATETRARFGNP